MSRSPTASNGSPGELFDDFLSSHDHCIAAGLVEAGYHALAAALLCAEAASSRKGLEFVIRRAQECQRVIDGERPPHCLSSQEAHARQTVPPFESLARAGKETRSRLTSGRGRISAPVLIRSS